LSSEIVTQRKPGDQLEPGEAPDSNMIWINGGQFRMGSDDFYPEERPVRNVQVDGFWIDRYLVTNERFKAFVDATGYQTVAERELDPADFPGAPAENLAPGSMLFHMTTGAVDLTDYRNWWAWVPGTNWQHPSGPESSLKGMEQHPVVHVAYEDAEAYASWAGKQLATEAEWEFAARGGLDGKSFSWGDDDVSDTKPLANTWQGEFPWENLNIDGYEGTSPAGVYPANGFGLFDMCGNTWEWTADWYLHRHDIDKSDGKACCGMLMNPRIESEEGSYDPAQPQFHIPRKVVKGGSHLCAPNYCLRYRPAARQPQMVDTGMSHIGFRCIVRASDAG
jgi:sulfatase modifying factor 1